MSNDNGPAKLTEEQQKKLQELIKNPPEIREEQRQALRDFLSKANPNIISDPREIQDFVERAKKEKHLQEHKTMKMVDNHYEGKNIKL